MSSPLIAPCVEECSLTEENSPNYLNTRGRMSNSSCSLCWGISDHLQLVQNNHKHNHPLEFHCKVLTCTVVGNMTRAPLGLTCRENAVFRLYTPHGVNIDDTYRLPEKFRWRWRSSQMVSMMVKNMQMIKREQTLHFSLNSSQFNAEQPMKACRWCSSLTELQQNHLKRCSAI